MLAPSLLASIPAGTLNQSKNDLGIPDSDKIGKTLGNADAVTRAYQRDLAEALASEFRRPRASTSAE
jgi:hypothetical protein